LCKIWEVKKGLSTCLKVLNDEKLDLVTDMIVLKCGDIVSTEYHILKIWDRSSYECIQVIDALVVEMMAIVELSNGYLLTGGNDCIKLWARMWQLRCIGEILSYSVEHSLILLPNGNIFVSGFEVALLTLVEDDLKCIKTFDTYRFNGEIEAQLAAQLNNDDIIVSRSNHIIVWGE
jgi:hypothetical protein